MSELRGTVLERDGAAYRVLTDRGVLRAVLRGKAKRDDRDKIVVGDVVRLDPGPVGDVYGIVGMEERRSLLARRVPEGRGARPVAANVDRVFVVTAARDPEPVPQVIDRLLVVAEANDLPGVVILNKVDLDPGSALRERFERAGYQVLATSARSGLGIDTLRRELAGRTSVVTGPSGVGKSSLLNAVQPGLRLRVGEISAKLRRGRHTTVAAVMVPLEVGGFVVDTPGFSEVGLWDIEPEDLDACFPEMRPYLGECRYADCRHVAEPRCAVLAAVQAGAIDPDRLQSYHKLLEELEARPEAWE
ncbi:MAG TPA: ribosome small subunit-dependent GTPase A [Gemmatimonadales bacterium]|nr:ribosome small subunit-dependent GTPase A [Gemmatimonadales bacterium]